MQTFRENRMKCCSDEELLDFSLGKLDDLASERVTQHVEMCEFCQIELSRFDAAEDSLIEQISIHSGSKRKEANSAAGSHDSPPQVMLQDIKNRRFLNHPDNDQTDFAATQISDYRLVAAIGKGGMGTVFRATHNRLEKDVALKVLPERRFQNSEAISRFRREMKIIGGLDHPAIVQATDAGEDRGAHYLAMEFVDGFDLSLLSRLVPQIDEETCCEIIRQAAAGLEYVHSQNVVHRDIKPSNLMLSKDGTIKILDLGLAILSGMHGAVDDLTTVGQLMGTIDYMAPEQYGDANSVDHRADIYALGATLYRLLCGKAPYACDAGESGDGNSIGRGPETPLQKLKRISTEPIQSIRAVHPTIASELAEIVDRCMAQDPDERFQSAEEIANALRPFADDSQLKNLVEKARLNAGENVLSQDNAPLALSHLLRPSSKQTEISEIANKVDSLHEKLSQQNAAGNRSGNRRWRWATLAFFGFIALIACGIVLKIELEKGNLVIESDAPGVKVSLLKDGEFYKKLELQQGANSSRIRAGKYEITIEGQADKLVVENDVFELTRGDTILAKITRSNLDSTGTPSVATTPVAKTKTGQKTGQPDVARNRKIALYQGKRIDQWFEMLRETSFDSLHGQQEVQFDVTPIQKLIKLAPDELVKEETKYWVEITRSETDPIRIGALHKILDVLAIDDQSSQDIIQHYVKTLVGFTKADLDDSYQQLSRYDAKTHFFFYWNESNLNRLESLLFNKKHDASETARELRYRFLNFRIVEKNAIRSATNNATPPEETTIENVENAIRFAELAFKGSPEGNEEATNAMSVIDSLMENPENLSKAQKSLLIGFFEKHLELKEFRVDLVQYLAKLDPDSDEAENAILVDLDVNPNSILAIQSLRDLGRIHAKLMQLLRDPDWGWDDEARFKHFDLTAYQKRKRAERNGRTLGALMARGGGSGAMMGGPIAATMMPPLTMSKRELAIERIGQLGPAAKELLPVLREQQRHTSNVRYLEKCWKAVEIIEETELSEKLFLGRDLNEWKKRFEAPKDPEEFALSIIGCADLIGELGFLDRLIGVTSRGRSSIRFNGIDTTAIDKNKQEYNAFIRSVMVKVRDYDFESFMYLYDKSPVESFSDPKSAATIVCNNFALTLLEDAEPQDYKFLHCLSFKFDSPAFHTFLRDALRNAATGSLHQMRLVTTANDILGDGPRSGRTQRREFSEYARNELMTIFKDPKAQPLTRAMALRAVISNGVQKAEEFSKDELAAFKELIKNDAATVLEFFASSLLPNRNGGSWPQSQAWDALGYTKRQFLVLLINAIADLDIDLTVVASNRFEESFQQQSKSFLQAYRSYGPFVDPTETSHITRMLPLFDRAKNNPSLAFGSKSFIGLLGALMSVSEEKFDRFVTKLKDCLPKAGKVESARIKEFVSRLEANRKESVELLEKINSRKGSTVPDKGTRR